MKKSFVKGQKAWSSTEGEVEIIGVGGKVISSRSSDYYPDGRHRSSDKHPTLFHSLADCQVYFNGLKEKRAFNRWMNLNSDGTAYLWGSKSEADDLASDNRIECREIVWEVS